MNQRLEKGAGFIIRKTPDFLFKESSNYTLIPIYALFKHNGNIIEFLSKKDGLHPINFIEKKY